MQPSLTAAAAGGFAVYYLRADGAIGRAASADGARSPPPRRCSPPIRLSDPILWRGVDALASPFAQALTDPAGQPFVRLWFAGHGTESAASEQFGKTLPTPPDFSIGEAASTDGARFVPYPFDPVFDRVLEFLTHPSELDPAVIALGDTWLLYYRRADADGTSRRTSRSPARRPCRVDPAARRNVAPFRSRVGQCSYMLPLVGNCALLVVTVGLFYATVTLKKRPR